MQVLYIASAGSPIKDKRGRMEKSKDCFKSVRSLDAYATEIYFYPIEPSEKNRLGVLGYEKASSDKAIIDRVPTDWWGCHICVGGKGYYNGIPIKRGTCFLSWPYVKHSIVADADDPMSFYWFIMYGSDIVDFVRQYGYSEANPVFEIDCVDEMVKLFELGLNTDYSMFDVYEYTMGLARMLLSCSKPYAELTDEARLIFTQGRQYTKMTKQLLKNNYYTLSIAELANRIGVSDKHLSRVFLNDTGEVLKKYIIRKKFDFAARLIKSGSPPTEVANILKYSNYAAFHKMFVKCHGISPKQYAKGTTADNDKN